MPLGLQGVEAGCDLPGCCFNILRRFNVPKLLPYRCAWVGKSKMMDLHFKKRIKQARRAPVLLGRPGGVGKVVFPMPEGKIGENPLSDPPI